MTTGMKNKLREDFNAESSKTQINSQATRKLVQMMDGFLRDKYDDNMIPFCSFPVKYYVV